MKNNKDILMKAIKQGAYYWQIALKFGTVPKSFSRMMYQELGEETKPKTIQTIYAPSKEGSVNNILLKQDIIG